jgi:hypothetical protein
MFRNRMGLVYTKPENNGNDLGTLIYENNLNHSKDLRLKKIYLSIFSYTKQLWSQIERITLFEKNIVFMKMEFI